MNNFLSERVNRLHESATIAMARISRELTEQGHNIISLSLGEPDFVTPKVICDMLNLCVKTIKVLLAFTQAKFLKTGSGYFENIA